MLLRSLMLLAPMLMSPEGGDAPGGGGGGGPAPTPTQVPTPTLAPAAPDDKGDLRTRLEASMAKGRAELAAALEASKADSAKTAAALEALKTEIAERDTKATEEKYVAQVDGLLAEVKIKPQFREWARNQLGKIDPATDAGKKAVDDLVAKYGSDIVEQPKQPSLDAERARFLEEKRKLAPDSAWNFIPDGASLRVD